MSLRPRALVAVVPLVLVTALAAAVPSVAAPVDDIGAFTALDGFRPSGAKVRVRPDAFTAYRVDLADVRAQLTSDPTARGSGTVVTLPTPEGAAARFAVVPTQVMEDGLAADHPEITTYAGRSLDTPGATVAVDVTPMGLHASVRGPIGTRSWYVDPAYDRRGTTTVLSYYGAAVDRQIDDFVEREAPQIRRAASPTRTRTARSAGGQPVTQRVYRLALTSDPSYAAYFGTANVLAQKVTLINRVNQVYNDDFAINLRLVDATDRLNLDTAAKATGANGPCGAHPCFDPAGADPEAQPGQLDFCDVPALGRNRTVLGQLVGASGYDIGHLVLGLDGGGIADLGVVGGDDKAAGCTGLPLPRGDFFAIDYVAHEMGHQFGANHTFDGVNGACSSGNRNGATSVEPGSGSSVMAYAGICGQDDLQPHTDPYFSQRSQDEIGGYTASAAYAGVEVQTVSLRGFDSPGERVTLGFPGHRPVTLVRGRSYTAAGIDAALTRLTGRPVSIAQWGYDEFDDDPTVRAPDDTGFQVIFHSTPSIDGQSPDEPAITVRGTSPGVGAFVGETAKGGLSDNRGDARTTGNRAPVVDAGADTTIPVRTPFTLTGRGTDADGDTLTYLWEQNDTGASAGEGSALADGSRTRGPLFRVFGTAADVTDEGTLESPSPGENLAPLAPRRTFPDLAQVLDGTTNARTGRCPSAPADGAEPLSRALRECYSELLPTRGYVGSAGSTRPALHFRLTARDGHPDGGGYGYDEVTLSLAPAAGPFRVLSQAGTTRVRPGSTLPVRWAVNGTRPLAARVRIRLSTDGGRTFGRVLGVTANDGSAAVVLPQVRTRHARLMVEAVGNVFFDVNHHRIRIG